MIKQEDIQQAIKDLTIVKSLPMLHGLLNSQLDMAIEALQFQKSVVRCKCCAHCTNPKIGCYDIHSHFDDNVEEWTMFDDDDFCSCGERSVE